MKYYKFAVVSNNFRIPIIDVWNLRSLSLLIVYVLGK